MLKKSGLMLAAAVAGTMFASGSGWTAQPLTPTQARELSKLKTVALLVAVPEPLLLTAVKGVCADIEAIDDWNFQKQIEDRLVPILSARFTLVPKAYDVEALLNIRARDLGQIPRSALPPGDDVDAFVVFWGGVNFWHPAGMATAHPQPGVVPYLATQALSTLLNRHDPELQFTSLTVDIINAKTKRTIARKEIQSLPYKSTFGPHMHVDGPGAKEREEKDWICGNPLTEEKKEDLKGDYDLLVNNTLDAALQLLRWAPVADKKQ